jgi:hypothetical protein
VRSIVTEGPDVRALQGKAPSSALGAMARLQLARALALSGDTAKAKNAYDDLFALWSGADPGIPIVDEARAEYARLQ